MVEGCRDLIPELGRGVNRQGLVGAEVGRQRWVRRRKTLGFPG